MLGAAEVVYLLNGCVVGSRNYSIQSPGGFVDHARHVLLEVRNETPYI